MGLAGIKDSNGLDVVYWIHGSAGVCPKCGNHNAMLDKWRTEDDCWYEDLECRDCGYIATEGEYRNVEIRMDVDQRRYIGIAMDGEEVDLGGFEGTGLERYLKHYPTPDTW
jgi:Zn ribbon nucleic-acid-binding protein